MPDNDLADVFAEVSQEVEVADNDVGDVDAGVEVVDVDGQADEPDVESVEVDIDDEVEGDEVDDNPEGIVETWDWSEYSDQLVPRTVNGQTEMVTLKEAIEGSMRQADYTRKTQELAEAERLAQWAKDIQAGFERDPMGMLESFADAYGLLDQQRQAQESNSLDQLDEDVRPWAERTLQAEQQLAKMQQSIQQVENERIKNQVRSEIEMMKSQYGDSFDPMATLEAAAKKNMSLEDAHWYLMGQRSFNQSQQAAATDSAAEQAAQAAKASSNAQRAKAKAKASSTTTQAFKASDIPADDFNTIGELFEQIASSSS